jgi:perosamine synthetase
MDTNHSQGVSEGDPKLTTRIPWAEPVLWGSEERFVLAALTSNWLSGGPYVKEFEQGIRDLFGYTHCISTSNGTSAIQAAYLALGLEPGDEVIIPGFGFLAAANVAMQLGLVPRFADVDEQTWCINPDAVSEVIGPKTRCIVAIHTYGNVCAMEELTSLANQSGIAVLEDAAEALGSKRGGIYAGNLGAVGTLSFQATKTLSTGEGGMVACRDPLLADLLELHRNHGMSERKYFHLVPGNNFRLTNLQAALGCAQLLHIGEAFEAKNRLHVAYRHRLKSIPGLRFQFFEDDVDPVVWATGVWIDVSVHDTPRDLIIRRMASFGVETRPGFYPASSMPMYQTNNLPTSENLANQIVVLPSSPRLTSDQIEQVCKAFEDSLQ